MAESLRASLQRPDYVRGRALRYRCFVFESDWETLALPHVDGNTLWTVVKQLDRLRHRAIGEVFKAEDKGQGCGQLPLLVAEVHYDGEV